MSGKKSKQNRIQQMGELMARSLNFTEIENQTGSQFNKFAQIDFIWMTRDQDSFEWFGDLLDFFQKQWDVFNYHLFLTSRNKNDVRSSGMSMLVGEEYSDTTSMLSQGICLLAQFCHPFLP